MPQISSELTFSLFTPFSQQISCRYLVSVLVCPNTFSYYLPCNFPGKSVLSPSQVRLIRRRRTSFAKICSSTGKKQFFIGSLFLTNQYSICSVFDLSITWVPIPGFSYFQHRLYQFSIQKRFDYASILFFFLIWSQFYYHNVIEYVIYLKNIEVGHTSVKIS